MPKNLEKAISPFSTTLIGLLFVGLMFFVQRWGDRVETKLDQFSQKLGVHDTEIAELKVQIKRRKKCSTESYRE